MSREAETFDLAELAAQLSVAERSLVLQGWVGIGMGSLLVLVGVYFGVFSQTSPSTGQVAEGVLIAAAGIAVAVAARRMMLRASLYPTRMQFDQAGFKLGRPEENFWISYRWDDQRFQLTLFDRTGVSAKGSEKSAFPTFTILPWKGGKAAVPREAFELTLNGARAHGLSVSRHEYGSSSTRWGTVVVHTVRASANR
jgi:hypothetical protein